MNKATRAAGYLRTAMLFFALALPAASLILLGLLWLDENNFLVQWALAAVPVGLVVYGFQRLLLRQATLKRRQRREEVRRLDPLWTDREVAAWDAVRTIADEIDPSRLNSRNAFLALGTRTVEAVGQCMFSGEDHPLWRFTVPELLAFFKRVSEALDPVVREHIPYGETLTIGQAMAVYQWRSIIGVTEAAYDLSHLLKGSPADTAPGTQEEARQLDYSERKELGRRIASAYVRVVGRAAIDLYGGRLRPASLPSVASTEQPAIASGQPAQPAVKPLRILVAGQVAAGKSSLIGALLRQIKAKAHALPPSKSLRAYELKRDGVAEVLLIDSPGIEANDVAVEALKTQAQHCDVLIWVSSAMGPERGRDRKVLDALRLAAKAERRYPQVLSVYTHIDQLQPILDWSPPYNLDRAESPKAKSIGKALLTVASDLRVPIQAVVPVCLDQMRGAYNVDVLWAKILDVLPEGQRARLGGAIAVAGDDGYWKRLWIQATVNGRVVSKSPTAPKDDMFPGQMIA